MEYVWGLYTCKTLTYYVCNRIFFLMKKFGKNALELMDFGINEKIYDLTDRIADGCNGFAKCLST